jgi:RNA polymerase sigma-70 factor (ECF subfamily)
MSSGFKEITPELFEGLRKGDRVAFSEFYKQYQQDVFNFCYAILHDYQKAEDVIHDTFIKFYKSVHKIRDYHACYKYMLTIARNCCMDYLEVNTRESLVSPIHDDENEQYPTIDDLTVPAENNPEMLLSEKENCVRKDQLIKIVNETMKKLSPNHRAAIFLVHLKGHTYEEAGEILGWPPGTVKSTVSRGVLKLGRLLKKYKVVFDEL